MRYLLVLLVMLFVFTGAIAQPHPDRLFELQARQYDEDGGKYIGVSARIKPGMKDTLGQQINRYHRRFDYLLQNKTNLRNGSYDVLYPDTLRMNRLFISSLVADTNFMRYLVALTGPLSGLPIHKEKYTITELMQTASYFFYCDGIREDSTVSSHICIVLNGAKEAPVHRDYTLLEAFCFEAIFANYYTASNKRNQFVDNFVSYIKEAEQTERKLFASKEKFLLAVRQYCFKKMENDPVLREALLNYYNAHKDTFPFTIE